MYYMLTFPANFLKTRKKRRKRPLNVHKKTKCLIQKSNNGFSEIVSFDKNFIGWKEKRTSQERPWIIMDIWFEKICPYQVALSYEWQKSFLLLNGL